VENRRDTKIEGARFHSTAKKGGVEEKTLTKEADSEKRRKSWACKHEKVDIAPGVLSQRVERKRRGETAIQITYMGP